VNLSVLFFDLYCCCFSALDGFVLLGAFAVKPFQATQSVFLKCEHCC
jgi:hypothetical protein